MSTFESEPPLVPAPILATPGPSQTNALIGPLGLRAGWGILLFFVVSAVLGTVLFLGLFKATGRFAEFQREGEQARQAAKEAKAAHRQPVPQPVKMSFQFPAEIAQAGAVLLTGFGLSFLERRRFGVYGLTSRHLRDILPGAFWGLVSLSVLVGLLRGFHLLVFDGQLLHGTATLRYGLAWLVFFLLVGIFEEFLFRGYIQFTLMRGLLGLGRRLSPSRPQFAAFWISALIWSLVFLLAHTGNTGENPAGLIGVFLAGILFSYALWRTGSLWWGIGFHMTWDWAQSFLYGVPDSGTLSVGRLFATHAVGRPLLSGGVDGPEGSILLIPIFLLMFLVIRLQPQAAQPPVEPVPIPPSMHSPEPEPIA